MQYESAGKRRDGTISREGSVALRRALIDLGIWPVAHRTRRESLCRRTENHAASPAAIIGCALAHRATRIAHALVRDHASYDPSRWG